MKRYIRSNNAFSIKVEVIVDSFLEEKLSAASKIKPVRPNYPVDDTVDEQALANYHAFIEEAIGRIEDCELEVIDHNSSNKSETSEYYTLMDLTQDTENTAEFVIFLRISDHAIEVDPERMLEIRREVREHRKYYSTRYSEMQGHKIKWKVREVIVNGTIYKDYDTAVEAIAKLAKEWSKTLQNNTYEE